MRNDLSYDNIPEWGIDELYLALEDGSISEDMRYLIVCELDRREMSWL